VVAAFGQELTEMKNYEKYLGRAKATGIKTHFRTALTISLFFFAMFAYYAYSFYIGSIFITIPKENTNKYITEKSNPG
jgi:hypothetical protein